MSITAPSIMATAPPTPRIPCDANFASSTVSVLLGTGNGTFGAKTDYGAGSGPWSVAIRDLTGDGKPDLAVANFASNTVSVLRGNGNGTFGTRIDFGTGNKPISVAIEDLNGDGKPDLAAANYGSNTLSVLANTCSDPSGPTLLSPGDCSTATSNPYFVWQGIAGAASYQIAVSTNRLMTAPVWTTQCGSNSKTALYAGNPLSPGTPYYWSVRALVGGTWTPYAAAREFVRHSGTPAVAHPVLSAPVDQATLTLPETFSWDAVANAVSYRLKISTDATFVTSLWTSGVSTSPSLSVPGGIPGIANGQTYYWTVTAIDASGIEGPAATARRFVVSSSAAMPAQALLLSPSDGSSVTTQSVVFSWQAAAGATRFDLTYSTSPGFTVGSNTTWTLTDLTAPSTSVPLPAADVTIYWKVTPRNNSGAGPSSAVWSFHFNFSTGPITGITLLSPAHGLSIGLNARTTASARIVGSTSVIIYGHWRLDGADWAPFALVASNPNRILVNSLELPTGSASTHTVQCVVTSPSSAASLIQTYQVADRPPGAPASITATVTPATLTADGSSTAIVTVSVLDGTGLLVSTDNARPITIRVNGPASAVPASGITYDGQWTTGLVAGTTEGVALVTVEAAGLPAAVGRIPVAATYLTQLKKQAQAALDRLNPLPVPGLLASTPLIKLPQPDAQTMQALQDYVDNATDADTAGVLRLALAARTLGRIYTFHSSSDGGPGDLPVPGAMVLADDATQNLMAQIQLTVGVIVGIQKSAQLLHALNPLADQWIDEEISTLLEKLDDFVTQTLDDAGSAVDPTLRAAVLDGSQLAIGLMCAAATADWTHYFTTGVGVGLRAPVNAWILQEGFINAGAQSELTRALTLAQSPPARTAAQAWSSCQLAVDQARSTSTDFDRVSQSSKTDGDALSSLADVAALCSLLPGGMVAGVFAVTSEIWAAPQYMQGSATALQGLGNMPSIAHTAVTGIFGSTQASTSSDLARTASWTSRAGAHLASAPRAVWARLLEAEAAGQQSFEALAQMIAIAAAAGDAPGVASLLPQLISAADSLERASSLARAPLTAASADAPFEIAGYDTVATSTWQQANAASVGRATLSASALSYLLSPEDPTMRQAVVDAVASAINLNSQAHNATQHTVASLFTVPALPFVRLEQVDIPNTVTVGVPFHVQALWTNLGAGTATGVTVSMKSDSSLVVTSQNPLALPDLAPGDTARAVWVAIPARTFAADTLSRMLQLVRLSSRCENGYGSGHTRMAALAVPASTGVTGGHVFHPGLQLAVTPNPASSVATLRLTMPASGHARVEVYDVGGRRVATLSDGQLAAGTYQYRWVGLTGDQARAPSGVYLARVVTNRGTCTTRFVWIVQ